MEPIIFYGPSRSGKTALISKMIARDSVFYYDLVKRFSLRDALESHEIKYILNKEITEETKVIVFDDVNPRAEISFVNEPLWISPKSKPRFLYQGTIIFIGQKYVPSDLTKGWKSIEFPNELTVPDLTNMLGLECRPEIPAEFKIVRNLSSDIFLKWDSYYGLLLDKNYTAALKKLKEAERLSKEGIQKLEGLINELIKTEML